MAFSGGDGRQERGGLDGPVILTALYLTSNRPCPARLFCVSVCLSALPLFFPQVLRAFSSALLSASTQPSWPAENARHLGLPSSNLLGHLNCIVLGSLFTPGR